MRAAGHAPPSAIALIVVTVLCFTCLDATMKSLASRYPVPFLVFARYAVQMLAMLAWLLPRMGMGIVRTKRLPLQIARGALLPFSSLFFWGALRYLPLAEATAINYSTPVLVMLLAVVFLGERMTRSRISLALAGLAGMFIIVRPGSEVFQPAALLGVAAAVVYAVFQILTRKLAAEDSRVTLFFPAICGTLMFSLGLPWYDLGSGVPWQDAALIAVAGLLGTCGHFMLILAFQRAPASALTPFTYSQLVWATLVGWIGFGTFPDAWTLVGMAVITGSGLLIVLHERRRARGALREPTAVD